MPPPGVSLFRRLCCYLDRPPAPHGPLRHLPPPGVSLFRHLCCYLKRQPALHGPPRHPPPPSVSRFHQKRLIPASRAGLWSGTMAAGAREQAASCSTQKHRRRPPAPDAPPILVRGRKQVAADLAKVFEDRCLFEEGVCRWHITGEIPVRTMPLSTHAGFPKSAR